jgi:hypothetical protein
MNVPPVEIVRHFLRLEATRKKYSDRSGELLAWCSLPDSEVMAKARQFTKERYDVNPALLYTVGIGEDNRHTSVKSWTRERVQCREIYTCGISSSMRPDIDSVRGNLIEFALQSASKYPEFRPLSNLSDATSIVILVHHRRDDRAGDYEVIDGVHRLVALCRAGIQDVEAYVAHMR